MIEADFPGVRQEDIDVEVKGREVAITGELRAPVREDAVQRHTHRSGTIAYRVLLPREVEAESATARLGDGVLTVILVKAEPKRDWVSLLAGLFSVGSSALAAFAVAFGKK